MTRTKYYGLYLIPPPALVYHISVAHHVFASEFSAITAGRFMAHCTIKGFTKLAPDFTPGDLIPAFDQLFSESNAFAVRIHPPWLSTGGKPGESILLWTDKVVAFQDLHNAVWGIFEPHIASDCLFTPREFHADRFPPHFTLVQSDIPPDPILLDQALSLADHIYNNFPTRTFLARDLQLVEFESDDWENKWWQTLSSRQLKAWRLPSVE